MQDSQERDGPSGAAPPPHEPLTHTARLEPSAAFVAEQAASATQSAPPAPPTVAPSVAEPMTSDTPAAVAGSPSVYPDASRQHRSWNSLSNANELRQAETDVANADFSDFLTLGAGIASATSYMLLLYLVKNLWVTIAISVIVAGCALYLAMNTYRQTRRLSPLGVIGISAATITIVFAANALIAYMVTRTILT